jgi:DNA-binding beta-propeller fold protein YncE
MPVVPALPPHTVPIVSGFDYVAVDERRRRVYAAHTGSDALTVIDADTGAVRGQVDVGGPLHGVAVDPKTGIVYTGDGLARTVSQIDPKALKVLATVDVAGSVDAIAYDPDLHRVYADEDDGTRMFVIDTTTMRSAGTVALPGHKPEFLDIDPVTHAVYQNIANLAEIAVIDPKTLRVTKTIATAGLVGNHPLQYDPQFGQIVVAGKNGAMAVYSPQGARIAALPIEPGIDQCNLDRKSHMLACAGDGGVTVLRLRNGAAPVVLGKAKVDSDVHTLAIDGRLGRIWIVWSSATGDFTQPLHFR